MATAARMPMIATTIISSIRVKPRWIFFIFENSCVWEGKGEPGDSCTRFQCVPSLMQPSCQQLQAKLFLTLRPPGAVFEGFNSYHIDYAGYLRMWSDQAGGGSVTAVLGRRPF